MTPTTNTYDSVDLFVWSGTGNTRHVAERIAESARTGGAEARVITSSTQPSTTPSSTRLVGLLAPTHGFTAPWPLIKAAFTAPNVRKTDAFVLVTRGGTRAGRTLIAGFEGTASYLPAAILALRGARIRAVGAIDMPVNWTVIHPSFGPESVAAIVERGDAQTDAFASKVLAGKTAFRGLPQLLLGLLILPISLGYMIMARLLLAKMFYADERCTSCGTCVKGCPQGAIHLRGGSKRPYWSYHCHNCMRCMSTCPTDAIQGAQGFLLLYLGLNALPLGALAAAALLKGSNVSSSLFDGLIAPVADYIWLIAAVWVLYSLLWFGLLVPGLRIVLSRLTFTRLYRRYRGPEADAYRKES